MATALTGSIAKDGQTTPTGNLPMGGFAHTGVADATVRTQYASVGQVQDGTPQYLTSVAGTNVITATASLGMTAYATGQTFRFIAAASCTDAVTLNINAIGAKAIVRTDGSTLAANDIVLGATVQVMYNGTNFQLLNNANGFSSITAATTLQLKTGANTALTATAAQDLFTGTTDTAGLGGQTDALRVIGTSGTKSSIAQFRYTNDNGSPNIRQYKSRGTTVGSFTAVQSADNFLAIQGFASDGTAWINSAQITFTVAPTVSTGVVPSNIAFNTTNSVGSQTTQAAVLYTGDFQFNSGYGSLATAYGCRAWVNFNGTGTVAIRASGNVSSITDNGVGLYTVNLTTAMPDINYAVAVNAVVAGVTATIVAGDVVTASSATTYTHNASGTLTDASQVFAAIFR
jgi:hypothetical protein